MDYAGKHTITGYLLDTYGDASFARKGCDAHTLASTREQRQQSLHWSRGARSYLLVSCCGMIAHVLLKRARTVRRVDQLIIDLSVMIFALWGPGFGGG
jgi:hypothetical protein